MYVEEKMECRNEVAGLLLLCALFTVRNALPFVIQAVGDCRGAPKIKPSKRQKVGGRRISLHSVQFSAVA